MNKLKNMLIPITCIITTLVLSVPCYADAYSVDGSANCIVTAVKQNDSGDYEKIVDKIDDNIPAFVWDASKTEIRDAIATEEDIEQVNSGMNLVAAVTIDASDYERDRTEHPEIIATETQFTNVIPMDISVQKKIVNPETFEVVSSQNVRTTAKEIELSFDFPTFDPAKKRMQSWSCLRIHDNLVEPLTLTCDKVKKKFTIKSDKFSSYLFYYNLEDIWQVSVTNTVGGTATADPLSGVEGEIVTLEATPSYGYIFKEWQVKNGSVSLSSTTTESATFIMPHENVEINAVFEKLPEYPISVISNGNGTCGANYTSAMTGSVVTLSATPSSGYMFDSWVVERGNITLASLTSPNTSFVMGNSEVVVKGNFVIKPITDYSISVYSDDNGTASASTYSAEKGIRVRLNANPYDDYEFDYWSSSPKVSFDDDEKPATSFKMPGKDVKIMAHFKKKSNNNGNNGNNHETTEFVNVVFRDWNGTELKYYGGVPKNSQIQAPANPQSFEMDGYTYTFVGWWGDIGGTFDGKARGYETFKAQYMAQEITAKTPSNKPEVSPSSPPSKPSSSSEKKPSPTPTPAKKPSSSSSTMNNPKPTPTPTPKPVKKAEDYSKEQLDELNKNTVYEEELTEEEKKTVVKAAEDAAKEQEEKIKAAEDVQDGIVDDTANKSNPILWIVLALIGIVLIIIIIIIVYKKIKDKENDDLYGDIEPEGNQKIDS